VNDSTTPIPARKSKKQRSARVLGKLLTGELLVRIEEVGPRSSLERCYYVKPIPADFGKAFRWEKFAIDGGDVHAVNVGGDGAPACCCCKGFERWGHCKHVDCSLALIAAGKLS
jgi:hypothetical protein